MMQQLPNHRVLKLRYEQVLEDPVPHLRASAEFCGIDASDQKLEAMTAGINGSRAYSYLSDPEHRDFVRFYQVALAERGYK